MGQLEIKADLQHILDGSVHHAEKLKRTITKPSAVGNTSMVHFNVCEALENSIPLIANNPRNFVHVLKYFEETSWLKPGNLELSTMFANFLVNLVSANGCFLAPTIKLLVHNFWYAPVTGNVILPLTSKGAYSAGTARSHEQGKINSSQHPNVGIILHVTIATLFQYIPLGKQILIPIIMKRFPHQSICVDSQFKFFSHILHMTSYFPEDTKSILNLLIERMIKLDVEIKVDDAYPSEDEADYEMKSKDDVPENEGYKSPNEDPIFDMEEDINGEGGHVVIDGGDGSHKYASELELSMGKESGSKSKERKAIMVDKTAEVLDIMMNVLLKYLENEFDASKNEAYKKKTFVILQGIFERTILRTHRSKYVQFILFWVASKDPIFAKSILYNLIQILGEKSIHMFERRTCAAYLASFVSRANYLDFDVVYHVLFQFVTLAKVYLNGLSNKTTSHFYHANASSNLEAPQTVEQVP